MSQQHPVHPNLPPPLMTSEPNSFARRTITGGKPRNIEAALQGNAYPAQIVAALHDLRRELATEPIRPPDPSAPDADFWHAQWAAHQGRTWLEVPWYFAEAYFYRRLLEATGYFRPGPWQGHDPFTTQKKRMLEEGIVPLAEVLAAPVGRDDEAAATLIGCCLWGNRADLSNWGLGLGGDAPDRTLLIDHTPRLVTLLRAGCPAVGLVADNTGLELLFDLALADFLLRNGWARRITVHLKVDPFFVSDALPQDVHHSLGRMTSESGSPLPALASRLRQALDDGRLVLSAHPFWNSCLTFHDMTPDVRATLERADLILLKGDANYRRLLGDRHWSPTIRLEEVAHYFPQPFAVLRTMKAELVVGLEPGQAEALSAEDPDWMVNGRRGIIQVVSEEV
ncbi:MAG: damage-control phosphatase ARMT1 family protein [Chloroflexota bacterium]|nr:damage-control phosphatase ARMT1 family protein [Chloroflexota bacterium]